MWKPHGNHKGKTCSSYTKENDQVVKECGYQKTSKPKNRKQDKNKGSMNLQINQKPINKTADLCRDAPLGDETIKNKRSFQKGKAIIYPNVKRKV